MRPIGPVNGVDTLYWGLLVKANRFRSRRRKSVDQQTDYHHLADVLSHETISIDRIFRDIS